MKVRLEQQRTSLRLSKDEFQNLLNFETLSERTVFPDGHEIGFVVELGKNQHFSFENNLLRFILPNQLIQIYKPNKVGLSFEFQDGDSISHELIFEVDIKKAPLGAPTHKKK